jgi:hypothetical protein
MVAEIGMIQYYRSELPLAVRRSRPMSLSNLQAAILAIIVIVLLVTMGWTIREKSKTGESMLPEFIQRAITK